MCNDMGNVKLSEHIQIRLTKYEKNRIRGLAKVYAGGDMSLWLRWAGLNAERKYLIYDVKRAGRTSPPARKRNINKKINSKAKCV